MADTNFNKIIDYLKKIHKKYPTMRFGEVAQVAMDKHKAKKNADMSDITSKDFLNGLKKYFPEEANINVK